MIMSQPRIDFIYNTPLIKNTEMIHVAKALEHFHNKLDQKNQWKRAVDNLKEMSNEDHAKTWVYISSQTQNNMQEYSDKKIIFAMALKEALQTKAIERDTCTCSEEINKLDKSIRELRFLVCLSLSPHARDQIKVNYDSDFSADFTSEIEEDIEKSGNDPVHIASKDGNISKQSFSNMEYTLSKLETALSETN